MRRILIADRILYEVIGRSNYLGSSLLDIAKKESTESTISKVTLDGVDVNADNLHKVFKIVINKKNLPVSFDNVGSYHHTVGNKLSNNSYMLFDIWGNDLISYLLSLGNKMTW